MDEASQLSDQGHRARPVAGEAIADFHIWVRDTQCRNACKSGVRKPSTASRDDFGFVTESELRRYMTEVVVNAILRQILSRRPHTFGAKDIIKHCLQSFATLLAINRGHFVEQFLLSAELRDTFPLHLKPRSWPASDNDLFWDDFYKKQWRFCPIKLERHSRINYNDMEILPFLEKHLIGRGSSAKAYTVKVHRDLDELNEMPPVWCLLFLILLSIS